MTLLFRHRSFSAQSAKKGTPQQPNHMNRILNLTPKEAFQILFLAEFVPKGAGGHYGLTGRPIKNLKMPKKVRQGGQNLGKITRKLELETFFASNGKLFFSK